MTDVTCRLTAKNRDQLRNPTLGNRVWATFFTFGDRQGYRYFFWGGGIFGNFWQKKNIEIRPPKADLFFNMPIANTSVQYGKQNTQQWHQFTRILYVVLSTHKPHWNNHPFRHTCWTAFMRHIFKLIKVIKLTTFYAWKLLQTVAPAMIFHEYKEHVL